jgi:SAM-dependent methyltransferase
VSAPSDDGAYWRRYFDDAASRASADHERVGYTSAAYARHMHAAVRRALGPLAGQRILDAGCGDGQVLGALAEGNVLVGMDFSPAMAAGAARRGLRPVGGDLLRLPFRAASFDVVVCAEALSCLTRPEDAVPGLAALVRPGGRLLLSGLNRYSLLRHVVRTIGKLQGRVEPAMMDPLRVARLLDRAGFDVEPVWWVGYVPKFVVRPRTRAARALLGVPATNFILVAHRRGRAVDGIAADRGAGA